MPSRLSNGAVTTTGPPRFELPALDLNFGRITDGTNIPPPPSSPVQKVPTPPQTPPGDSKKPAAEPVNGTDEPMSTPPNGNTVGSKRSADEAPLSPAGSGRQGSLRRLFSKNVLSANYTEGRLMSMGNTSVANGARPESRGTTGALDDRKARRSSGWFRRLRGTDPKRASYYFEDAVPVTVKSSELPQKPYDLPQKPAGPPPKPSGPPPPMIPELVDLERDEGSLGRDLFKNIK
ncbi:hypothetical protein CDD83_236 [Cordyceps sp. RAO-2017]|nr:hypothetical protein CDD83_236 [Cordyceps sp. RAO-2017]